MYSLNRFWRVDMATLTWINGFSPLWATGASGPARLLRSFRQPFTDFSSRFCLFQKLLTFGEPVAALSPPFALPRFQLQTYLPATQILKVHRWFLNDTHIRTRQNGCQQSAKLSRWQVLVLSCWLHKRKDLPWVVTKHLALPGSWQFQKKNCSADLFPSWRFSPLLITILHAAEHISKNQPTALPWWSHCLLDMSSYPNLICGFHMPCRCIC